MKQVPSLEAMVAFYLEHNQDPYVCPPYTHAEVSWAHGKTVILFKSGEAPYTDNQDLPYHDVMMFYVLNQEKINV